jgi:hypothetical protein
LNTLARAAGSGAAQGFAAKFRLDTAGRGLVALTGGNCYLFRRPR